jgi:hypothetical protein
MFCPFVGLRVRAPQSARGVRIIGTLQHGVCMRRTFMAVLPKPRRSFDTRGVFSDAITTHAAQPFVPALRCSHACEESPWNQSCESAMYPHTLCILDFRISKKLIKLSFYTQLRSVQQPRLTERDAGA